MSTPKTRINRSDLKIFPSERLTDDHDGGGMPTGMPIQGVANELFNPISSISRVTGGFFARSIFAGVQRTDAAPLIGAFVAITKPPKDENVSYLLFPATKFGETRAEILKRIEAYSVATIESRMSLLSTQSANSGIVQACQRVGEPLPLVGDVYCLRQDKKGYPNVEQYIQVTKVGSEDRTFTNPQTGKDFVRTVVKMEISNKLKADFVGVDYPSETYVDNPCKVRETHVADAGQYYGVKPLVKAIEKSSMKIVVSSLMEKIVPTNQVETRLVDLSASGHRQTLFDGSQVGDDGLVVLLVNITHSMGAISKLYAGNAILPNSVQLLGSKGVVTDKGGTLYQNDVAIGAVDYGVGEIVLNEPAFNDYLTIFKFRPATNDSQVADTAKIDVSINNRGYNYILTLNPAPAVGTLQVSYRSHGRWYHLVDDGSGSLRGASLAHGSGHVNFVTGTVQIGCGELPDVGSAILLSWGTKARYFNRANHVATAKMLLQLSHDADPASIRLSWENHGAKSATVSASGQVSGDWTGQYDPKTRQIRIDTGANFNHPVGVLDVKVDYSFGDKIHKQFKAPLRDGQGRITVDLGDVPIQPNTVRLRWNLLIENYDPVTMVRELIDPYKTVRDDGAGKLIDEAGVAVGTVDYVARKATFSPDTTVNIPKSVYKDVEIERSENQVVTRKLFSHYEYIPAGASMPIDESGLVEVWFFDTGSKLTKSEILTSANLEIDLLPSFAEVVAPSSVNVKWGTKQYFDKLGSIYTDLDVKTGSAVKAGSIDYQSGKLLLTNWQWTNGASPAIISLVTSVSGNPVDSVVFRTPSSPIRPNGLQIRATAIDGTAIDVVAKTSGEIQGEWVSGVVDAEYGVVSVRFGKLVNANGKENESWYNAEQVKDGKIWQPMFVFAHSITYNAVAYSYLPVASDVVKIDTVRLPQDGRVPIFRRGDTILLSNSQEQNIGSAFTGGQTVQLERGDLDRICLQDSNGKPVLADLWEYDLQGGSITFVPHLDLSDYQLPLIVKHTQEEKNLITEVDIDGTLTLRFATKRAYPIENTYVSSVLIYENGNLQVKATVPFTQRNWNNVWQDMPVGEQLLNRLNVKDYPIVLTDDGAITERWVIIWKAGGLFELYGETLGFVLKTDTLQDLAPINPATKKPYFTIPKQAFGNDAPWAVGDVVRFNTEGALMPVWVLCAVQPTANPLNEEDGFTVCLFGDTTEI